MYSIDQDTLFSFYDRASKKPVIHIAEEIFEGLTDLSNMELGTEKTTGFIAGSKLLRDQSKSDKKSIAENQERAIRQRACLLSFDFEPSMKQKSDYILGDQDGARVL